MTIQSETSKVVYLGNSSTTTFPIPFYFLDNEIAVYKGDDITPLVQSIDYTISGSGNKNGGEIIFKTAPQNDEKITISRDVKFRQLTRFMEGEIFPAVDYEKSLDRIVMALQQLKENCSRAISVPFNSDNNGGEFYDLIKSIDKEFDTIKQIPTLAREITQKYESILEKAKPTKYTNIVVPSSTITEDTTYSAYPYKVDITLDKATSSSIPTVVLSMDDATTGVFAPIAEAYDGYVRLYLKTLSNQNITIPVILLH